MPPKSSKNQSKVVVYPPGVKEITDDLGMDELVRRLKTCAQSFQNMGQDDNNAEFIPLALHLAQDLFLEHSNKDVRLLVACCIADVFRVYAPEAPYKDPEHLKNIFLFFIKQLRGLADPKDAAFKRYFYLLENLAWVKSFNICIELEDNQEIFCRLFTLMFSIVNDDHSTKVKGFMLDMMAPLISEADSMTQELLDIILGNIIEPKKSQNRNAYNLAKELLKKTASTIEPYIQAFFNNALILGKTSDSDVATHLYELIYELNSISPRILLAVLPQLEFKLKSNDEKERLDVTRLLARMFSDKNAELAVNHRALWSCFLGRFNDISVSVRNRCVQYSMHFLLNHPELRTDITEQLKQRQHDPEESVRYEVVMAIISAAKRDFSSISDELLDFVKERTLDKKFKIRKEALVGLSMIFKRCMTNPEIPDSTRECVSWIKNKVLHVYYQTALEDRLLVERILHTCLVPYQLPPDDRMKKLYQLFATVDEHAVKAFNELLKCQNTVRNHVRGLLELHSEDQNDEIEKQIAQKINILAKSLPDPIKAHEFLKKFNTLLLSDARIRGYLDTIVKPDCLCRDAEDNVRELLKKLGNPVMTNVFYMTVKQLLERVAPVMVDKLSIQVLLNYVDEANTRDTGIVNEIGSPNAPERGLQLLHTLSYVFPGSFLFADVYTMLLGFLQLPYESAAEITLQIFCNIGDQIETNHPEIADKLITSIIAFTKEGTMKQAKYAVKCLDVVTKKTELYFGGLIEDLKKNLTLECEHFRTALVSIGHIAYLYPDLFGQQMKPIVYKMVVKDLLMQDREAGGDSEDDWCPEEELSDETKAKIEGMKLMVRWIVGLKNNQSCCNSTLKLLASVIENDGDLLKKGKISKPEMAWLRMTAGCCLLKIVQEQVYFDLLTTDQFQIVAALLNDESVQVRERFAQKIHKGLIILKLPLDFLAVFALGSKEREPELKKHLKQYLLANINKRRDIIKQQSMSNKKLSMVLPEYVLPHAIYLLAHHPDYKKYDHVPTLNELRECLWFLMEPLVTKNESYSFSFVKKLLDNVKQTKDAQNPNDEVQNMKLYAVCDLAVGLVMSKTANFVLKDFPVEPTALPSKLFTEIDRSFLNSKIYLPPDLASMFPKSLAFDIEYHKAKPSAVPGTVPKRGRGRPPTGASAMRRGVRPNDSAVSPHLEGDESGDHPASKRARGDNEILELSEVPYEEVVGAVEIINRENQEQQLAEEQEAIESQQVEEAEMSEQDPRDTTEETIEETIESMHTEGDVEMIVASASSFTTSTATEIVATSEQIIVSSERETEESQSIEETLAAMEGESVTKDEDEEAEMEEEQEEEDQEEEEEDAEGGEEGESLKNRTKTKTPSSPTKPEGGTMKRLRSAGPVAEPTKTTARSSRSQSTESKDSTSSNSATTQVARTTQRQSARKQVITTRRGISSGKEPKVSEAKEPVRTTTTEVPTSSSSFSKSSTTGSSSSPATSSTTLARRNLRRGGGTISNGSRNVNSEEDDDSQESGTGSSAASPPRKITRASTRIAAKDSPAPVKATPKKAPQRKGR